MSIENIAFLVSSDDLMIGEEERKMVQRICQKIKLCIIDLWVGEVLPEGERQHGPGNWGYRRTGCARRNG